MQRRSVPSRQLGAPGPDATQRRALFEAAMRVPDHGKLAPWRFLTIEGDARHRLGERLAARAKALDPNAPQAAIDKDRERFSFAPLIVSTLYMGVQPNVVFDITQASVDQLVRVYQAAIGG